MSFAARRRVISGVFLSFIVAASLVIACGAKARICCR
jgi:hypothetical protein